MLLAFDAALAILLWPPAISVDVVKRLRDSEGCPESNDDLPKSDGIRSALWLLFEYPESSRPAFVIGIISVIMTLGQTTFSIDPPCTFAFSQPSSIITSFREKVSAQFT